MRSFDFCQTLHKDEMRFVIGHKLISSRESMERSFAPSSNPTNNHLGNPFTIQSFLIRGEASTGVYARTVVAPRSLRRVGGTFVFLPIGAENGRREMHMFSDYVECI